MPSKLLGCIVVQGSLANVVGQSKQRRRRSSSTLVWSDVLLHFVQAGQQLQVG